MRVRAGGSVSRSRRSLRAATTPFLRLLPFICIFVIVAALGILALSEMSLMGKRVLPSVVGGGGAASRIMPGRMRHHSSSHQLKSSSNGGGVAFKIEPLLRRNAISVELWAQATVNKVRAATVKRYIEGEWGVGGPPPTCGPPPPPDCPPVPPALSGVVNVSCWLEGGGGGGDEGALDRVMLGGWWISSGCSSRHLVALVIPYRDRPSQLATLMRYIHPLLQRQQINYRIFLVEQAGNDTFNKGVLMNAGFLTALRHPLAGGLLYHCFVFHDVDMLPEDDRNLYTCPSHPRHMSVAVNELNYKLPYRQLVGGVFAIRSEHFFRVNGYSNLYWGWGGEDDDMGYRVEHVLSSISRPPEWIARYTMLRHEKRRPLAWKVRVKLLRTSWRRYRLDGLNTVQFQVIALQEEALYTRILVDVGTPPHNIRLIQQEQEAAHTSTDKQ